MEKEASSATTNFNQPVTPPLALDMDLESGPGPESIIKIEGDIDQESENCLNRNDIHESENAAGAMEFTELKPAILPELFSETDHELNTTFQPLLIPPIQYHDGNLNTLQPTLESEAFEAEAEPGIQIKTEIDIDFPDDTDTSADFVENSELLRLLTDEVDHRLNAKRKRGAVSNKKTFACGHCKKMFPSKNAVAAHISLSHINETSKNSAKTATRTKTSTTPSIRTSFSEIVNSNIHELKKTTYKIPQFKCNFCSKSFKTNRGKKRHLLLTHKKNQVVNESPSKNNSPTPATATAANHISWKWLPCKYCSEHFPTVSRLKAHFVSQHLNFQCSVCTESFIDEETLESHMDMSSHRNKIKCIQERFNYFCNVCSKGFHYKIQIFNHFKTMHRKLFYCTHCIKTFRKEAALYKHFPGCNQHRQIATIRQSAPDAGAGTDTGIKVENGYGSQFQILPKKPHPHVCNGCEEVFSNMFFNLKGFKKFNSSKVLYNCGKCPLLFGSSTALESHLESHTMKCHLCEFSYTIKTDLTEHLEIEHASEKCTQYCDMCKKEFTTFKVQEEDPESDDYSVGSSMEENSSDTFSECSSSSIVSELESEEKDSVFCKLEFCPFETKHGKEMALHSQEAHQLPKVRLPRLVFKIESYGVKIKAFL